MEIARGGASSVILRSTKEAGRHRGGVDGTPISGGGMRIFPPVHVIRPNIFWPMITLAEADKRSEKGGGYIHTKEAERDTLGSRSPP